MPFGLADTDFFYILLMGVYGVVFAYFIIKWSRNRGKIKVRVKTRLGEDPVMVKPQQDKLLIREGHKGRGRAEWKPDFKVNSLYQIPVLWGLKKAWCIDIIEGAEHAIEYDFDNKTAEHPSITKDDVKKYAEARILDKLSNPPKLEMPGLMWLPVILSIVTVALLVMIANRIGLF